MFDSGVLSDKFSMPFSLTLYQPIVVRKNVTIESRTRVLSLNDILNIIEQDIDGTNIPFMEMAVVSIPSLNPRIDRKSNLSPLQVCPIQFKLGCSELFPVR